MPGISLLNYFFQFLQPMGWVGRIHVCMFMCARTEVVLTISRASYDGAVSYAAANCSWCSIPLRLTLQSLARRVLCDGGGFFCSRNFLLLTVLPCGMPFVLHDKSITSLKFFLFFPALSFPFAGTLFAVVAGLEALASATGSVVYNNCFHAFSKLSSLPLVTQPAGYTYIVTALIVVPTPFVVL